MQKITLSKLLKMDTPIVQFTVTRRKGNSYGNRLLVASVFFRIRY